MVCNQYFRPHCKEIIGKSSNILSAGCVRIYHQISCDGLGSVGMWPQNQYLLFMLSLILSPLINTIIVLILIKKNYAKVFLCWKKYGNKDEILWFFTVTSCHVMLHQTCKFTLYFCNLNLNPHISLSYPPNKDSLKLIYLTCIWADLEVQSALYR